MGTHLAIETKTATELCPWCGSSIPRPKFIEIQTKIADQERKKLVEERARMRQELSAETQKSEARIKDEADKKLAAFVAERNQARSKIKELETREAAIRKDATAQAEARVKAETDNKFAALNAERKQVVTKLKQLETEKEKNLELQRVALEKDRDSQLLKLHSQHNRQREQLQQKVNGLTRQLQRKTADELGEDAEVDIYEALRNEFSRDGIARIKKGHPGADIRHEVLHKGIVCGTILIDSKNRQGWQNTYVTKLREDQMAAKADYAVLATTVFPSGKKQLYVDQETRVIVVSGARVVELVGLIRATMIRTHKLGLSLSEKAEKQDLLYKYISSEDYRQHLIEAERLTTDVLDLDANEKRSHDKVWEKRGRMVTRLRNVVREIDTEVSAILEGRTSASQ